MDRALAWWQIETKRWWPGSSNPEDVDPPLPHDTFFDREMPLYVDWDYLINRWVVPDQRMNRRKFDNKHWDSDFDTLRSEFRRVQAALADGLLSRNALQLVNEIYCSTYISDKTEDTVLRGLNDKLTSAFAEVLSVDNERVSQSPLYVLPLYHFTTLPTHLY